MLWIEAHDTIWEHHKTIGLARSLGITKVQAVGHLLALWHFTMRNAPKDGNLEPWGDDGVANACFWDGECNALCNALRENGFLEGLKIHDWAEYAMHYHVTLERIDRKKEQVRNRVRKYRELSKSKKADSNADVTHHVTRCNADTIPNHTIPNHTLPNITKPTTKLIVPSREEVEAYAKEQGFKIDAEYFLAHYEKTGWKIKGQPIKSWKACVITWKKNQDKFGGNNGIGKVQPRIVGQAAPTPGKYEHLG